MGEIIRTAEEELRRTQGVPRQITGRSEKVQWLAKRADYSGDFDTCVKLICNMTLSDLSFENWPRQYCYFIWLRHEAKEK